MLHSNGKLTIAAVIAAGGKYKQELFAPGSSLAQQAGSYINLRWRSMPRSPRAFVSYRWDRGVFL